jgi:ABC-type phosphate/phosphonate transport system substrate-binding protein
MKHGNRWFLVVVTTLALAPTVVQAWEHGPRIARQRWCAEVRRGWREAMRDTDRALTETRREMRRVRMEQRQAIREAYREARQAAREARRYFRW